MFSEPPRFVAWFLSFGNLSPSPWLFGSLFYGFFFFFLIPFCISVWKLSGEVFPSSLILSSDMLSLLRHSSKVPFPYVTVFFISGVPF